MEQAARDHSEKEPIKIDGERVFLKHCAVCHGDDGRKGMAGAKVLPESSLTAEERMKIVLQGRGNMMPYKGVLSMGEIEAVVKYTLTLE